MALHTYFADQADGTVLEFRERVEGRRIVTAKVTHLRLPGDDRDHLYGRTEQGFVRITRTVRMKPQPSRHDCDARCYNATGRTMNCECACGGKNHGRGAFKCEAA